MNFHNPVARAFEIARMGTCNDVAQIRAQLKREGYERIDDHLDSRSLRRQLLASIKERIVGSGRNSVD
ncbi:hypothetical protein [Novosphingobium sp. JCM 18896]|uniref:hypothetical protein n=1 Tax=Novosphingobium sp. JCM 18896 TaxID=2989731 RepID=UPI002221CBB1|nr:hypothetical protein [Novosphingobium sp. JCM 18896]MCW1430874.1 hypothetical protein [Novosphingobium sp. JCM 18896]